MNGRQRKAAGLVRSRGESGLVSRAIQLLGAAATQLLGAEASARWLPSRPLATPPNPLHRDMCP